MNEDTKSQLIWASFFTVGLLVAGVFGGKACVATDIQDTIRHEQEMKLMDKMVERGMCPILGGKW